MTCSVLFVKRKSARVMCSTALHNRFLLETGGRVPFSSPRITKLGLLIRLLCAGCLRYAAGCVLPLAREIGLPTALDCRAKRLLPGPDGRVPLSPLPRFATWRPSRTNPPWCGMFAIFALRRLISPEDGLPPWLLILRCSCGESAPEVALHKGLNEAICPASAVEISIIALRSYS